MYQLPLKKIRIHQNYQKITIFFSIHFQAFALLSDKLSPLLNGVRENKSQWLELAQNVQNKPNRSEKPSDDDPSDADPTKIINNNNIYSRPAINAEERSNGAINDIPKIVGKLGRLESHNYIQFKQNGSICDTITRDHATSDEAMDQ